MGSSRTSVVFDVENQGYSQEITLSGSDIAIQVNWDNFGGFCDYQFHFSNDRGNYVPLTGEDGIAPITYEAQGNDGSDMVFIPNCAARYMKVFTPFGTGNAGDVLNVIVCTK